MAFEYQRNLFLTQKRKNYEVQSNLQEMDVEVDEAGYDCQGSQMGSYSKQICWVRAYIESYRALDKAYGDFRFSVSIVPHSHQDLGWELSMREYYDSSRIYFILYSENAVFAHFSAIFGFWQFSLF